MICAFLSVMLFFAASPAWAIPDQQGQDMILNIANAGIVKTMNGDSASFSPQGNVLITTENSNTVVYEPVTWQEVKKIRGSSYCFSPNQDIMAVNGYNLLTFFNPATGKVIKSYGGIHIAFDAGCRMAAISNYTKVTNNDAKVSILNTSTGEVIRQVRGWMGEFSPNGKVLAVNRYTSSLFSAANQVLVYDTSTWQLIDSFDGFFEMFINNGKTLTTNYPSGQSRQYHDISAWAGNSSSEPNQVSNLKKSRQIRNHGSWQLDIDEKNKIITIYDIQMLSVKDSFRKGEFEATREYEERMSRWQQDYTSPVVLGKYDADKNGFAASLVGQNVFIGVPREKAREMQSHKTKMHAEGKLRYYDPENVRLINAALVDDFTKERFALSRIGVLSEAARISAPVAPKTETGSINIVPDFKTVPRPNDIAIVIGIETYQGIPKSDYSRSDAELVKEYLKALGFQERNINLIVNERATKSRIETAIEGWLPNHVKKDSRIVLYYSGHGAPEPSTGEAYIVPFDGDPNYLATSGYSLKRLYEKLRVLKTYETIVILDSCFSGAGGRSVLAKGARPLVIVKDTTVPPRNMAVLTATQGTQISTSSPEKGYGIFTYYFLSALKNGKKTVAEIYEYVKPLVEDEARALNVEQSPSINPDPDKLKGKFYLRR